MSDTSFTAEEMLCDRVVESSDGTGADPCVFGSVRRSRNTRLSGTIRGTVASVLVLSASIFAISHGSAAAADAPILGHATVAPLHVKTSTSEQFVGPRAVLYGVLYPKGHYAHFWFQWGRTARYGHMTEPSIDEGFKTFGGELVLGVLSKLRPHTLYHYRIVAKNAAGKSYGADRTFWTKGRPSS